MPLKNNFSLLQFLLAFIALNMLLILPSWSDFIIYPRLSQTVNSSVFHYIWLSADLVLIVIFLRFFRNSKRYNKVIIIASVLFISLFIYEVYREFMIAGMNRQPLLFNDMHLLIDSYYLAVDLFSAYWYYLVGATLLIAFLFLKGIPTLMKVIGYGFQKSLSISKLLTVSISAVVLTVALGYFLPLDQDGAPVQSVAIRIKNDLGDSFALLKDMHQIKENHSFHSALPEDVTVQSMPPNIYFFIVESYGKVLSENSAINSDYKKYMNRLYTSLLQHGWHSTSNYSKAPVIGGTSWLSALTLLSGKNISNQLEYVYFSKNFTPDLITYLKQSGYHSFLLQPPTRERPGLPVNNLYRFDTSIIYDDLHYSGRKYGWGIIPDQYSLEYSQKMYLQHAAQPLFLFFTMVSSHIPWQISDLPPFIPDEQSPEKLLQILNSTSGDKISHSNKNIPSVSSDNDILQEYLAFIFYDLQVIENYILTHLSEDTIILIIGDHQPPVLQQNQPNYFTPVHIISQNETYLSELSSYGFETGLVKSTSEDDAISHDDIFSIFFHLLQRGMKQRAVSQLN